jgi:DNA-binding transcriptional ArsR family regulator
MVDYGSSLDRAFAALADPTRRRMVERLSDGNLTVTDLARPLSITLQGTIKHLDVLAAAGLVTKRKTGRSVICSLEPQAMSLATAWLDGRRAAMEARLDRFASYLDALQKNGADS